MGTGVRERIFQPLGMIQSNFSVDDSQKAPDFALPYEEKDDEIRKMAFRNIGQRRTGRVDQLERRRTWPTG